MIDLILATDMAKHGEIIENFKQVLVKGFDHEDENHRTKVIIDDYYGMLLLKLHIFMDFMVVHIQEWFALSKAILMNLICEGYSNCL